jgi:glycosyltransferase involved in cell wall biosynthesis
LNVLFVSHCDFAGNSALHVLAVANELEARGLSPAICVPAHPETVDDVGRPPFPILSFAVAERKGITFPDGRGPDLVHAFTPREHVRRLSTTIVSRYGCPYVVHLEDNEEVILADAVGVDAFERLRSLPLAVSDEIVGPHRSHPAHAPVFLEHAAGVTVLLDTLLEFKPVSVPGVVFWPGFDEAVLHLADEPPGLRSELGLAEDDFVLVYTGNIHKSNIDEVRSLYLAVGALRDAGLPVALVKTGWNRVDMRWAEESGVGGAVRELGFVPRERVWKLLAIADALVQPGGPNAFNDYRFPSKLPDYLASGRPVVLPDTNIGRYLRNGVDALLLERGDAADIFDAVSRLMADSALRERLGSNGKNFALRELRWSKNVQPILDLYAEIRERLAP